MNELLLWLTMHTGQQMVDKIAEWDNEAMAHWGCDKREVCHTWFDEKQGFVYTCKLVDRESKDWVER